MPRSWYDASIFRPVDPGPDTADVIAAGGLYEIYRSPEELSSKDFILKREEVSQTQARLRGETVTRRCILRQASLENCGMDM